MDKHLKQDRTQDIKKAFDMGYLTKSDLNDAMGLGVIDEETYEKYKEKLKKQPLENKMK